MRHRSRLAALVVVASILALTLAAASPGATTTVRYGPFSLAAGSMDAPATSSTLRVGVRRPCLDCFVTGFRAQLVDATTGEPVHMMDSGLMLHHAVFASQFRSDATCGGTWLGLAGERFFASGDERTPVAMAPGYGYRVRWYDSWNMLVELMNHSGVPRSVAVQVTYDTASAWSGLASVKPIWLDIDNCGDSEYTIPPGLSDTHRDWTARFGGKLVAMIGHQHAWGVRVVATKGTGDAHDGASVLCDAPATLSEMGDVMAMQPCNGRILGTIAAGDVLRLHSVYDSPAELGVRDDVMGIMLGYVSR